MKKIVMVLSVLFFSIHCYAAEKDLASIIGNTLQAHQNLSQQTVPTIIYGGQDFSPSQIAVADGPAWSKQAKTWVG